MHPIIHHHLFCHHSPPRLPVRQLSTVSNGRKEREINKTNNEWSSKGRVGLGMIMNKLCQISFSFLLWYYFVGFIFLYFSCILVFFFTLFLALFFLFFLFFYYLVFSF
ncbi:hypothetical protein L873DRAFT_1848295 [Choiromyces venosus 120613-1]|uniref:Uncharacterized protein n=1 Tax=Choiromyces venosus 120613-1 TaxID=1336337 RepID=A0A3N4J4K9_9PEZI|nr:hypothetical protein L873DRAFT_1848295 [Choiromyces venosus 120613-1]